jgi:diacylglycerol kinase family enzyme
MSASGQAGLGHGADEANRLARQGHLGNIKAWDDDNQPRDRSTRRPALLVVNTASRRGRGAVEAVVRALQDAGVLVLARACERAGELSELIRKSRSEVDSVIIGGGDGTLNAAAQGLLDTGLPLGIIPLGTANDLARTLDTPSDLAIAAWIISGRKTRFVDLGDVNGHPFVDVADFGFGVDLTRALTRDAKSRFGNVGYPIAAARVLSLSRPFRVELTHATMTRLWRTVHVVVGNGRHYGDWGVFLGTGRVANQNRSFVSYSEAQAWARWEGIETMQMWRERMRRPRPDDIPASPLRHYDAEWQGWSAFLQNGRRLRAKRSDPVSSQPGMRAGVEPESLVSI